MIFYIADIDQILEDTVELEKDLTHLTIKHYEIDLLLEETKDW